MKKRRNRAKQTTTLGFRLTTFAANVRTQADQLPPGSERDRLLHKADLAEKTRDLGELGMLTNLDLN